jgi:hypothetical protein
VSGVAVPQYASADFRLGNFDATTFGIKYGRDTAEGNEWSVRAEYYQQSGTADLRAVIVQFGYRFRM